MKGRPRETASAHSSGSSLYARNRALDEPEDPLRAQLERIPNDLVESALQTWTVVRQRYLTIFFFLQRFSLMEFS